MRAPIKATQVNKKKQHEEVVVDKGVKDKRLLVVESEFARPLKAMARPGNTLSTVIREAWDCEERLGTMTKSQSAKATGAHISLIGHITEEELDRELPECDFFNGFANRFLWVEVERSQLLPHGGKLDPELLKHHVDRLAEALTKAAKVNAEMTRDEEAAALWEEVYAELTSARPGMLGAVTRRAEPQVLRLSMIFALTDGSAVIRLPHLKAALALWDYCFQSACRFFGHRLLDSRAQKILDALKQRPEGMTRKQILDEIFGRNLKAEGLASALVLLVRLKLAYSKTESTGGRTAERWFACV